MMTRLLNAFLPARTPKERAQREFRSVKFGPADIAIDCGANVGVVTAHLCKQAGQVYAFEPNPHAFAVLRKRFEAAPNVQCIPKGVSDQNGHARLYLHEHSDQDEVHWSTGSSLLDFKGNVRKDKFIDVELVDLCEFIAGLGRPVKLLKMDVEGVECAILRKLIESGIVHRIAHIFVETHEEKVPALRAETDAIRALIRARGIRNINLDWT
ncbi:MAG TPA: FkbM family methyltransferase [Kiritimatiellia bacterium]|nr:FkbM family methyltransferase [Kiritimatiellia bacterium]